MAASPERTPAEHLEVVLAGRTSDLTVPSGPVQEIHDLSDRRRSLLVALFGQDVPADVVDEVFVR